MPKIYVFEAQVPLRVVVPEEDFDELFKDPQTYFNNSMQKGLAKPSGVMTFPKGKEDNTDIGMDRHSFEF